MLYSILLVTILHLARLVTSYPYGSPACVSQPRHGGEPQKDREGLGITFTKEEEEERVFTLTLSSASDSDYFRGLLVQTKAPGFFLPGDKVVEVECTGFLGSAGNNTRAVTHADSSNKYSAIIQFQQDEGAILEPEFDIVILRNFTTFWSNIRV